VRGNGVIILSLFGALWAFGALHIANQSIIIQICPFLVLFGLIPRALALNSHGVAPPPEERRRTTNVLMITSSLEVLFIVIAVNLVAKSGRADLTMAAIAMVVGLHFFPLAHWLRLPLYWLTGSLLIGLGIAAVIAFPGGALRDVSIGFGATFILWASAVVLLAQPQGFSKDS